MSGGRLSRVAIALGALTVIALAAIVAIPRSETQDERVARLASELRCVVCQGLSVNDSPSESAREMRALISRRVAEGRGDDEIRAEFRDSYGEWVFLSPPLTDARAFVWLVPLAAIAAGIWVALSRIRSVEPVARPTPDQLALLRERARRDESEVGAEP